MTQSSHRRIHQYFLLVPVALLITGLVTACVPQERPDPPATNDPTATLPSPSATPVPTNTPTPTPLPPKELTVCQGDEPNTLFIYGGPTLAARNVLDALYDGPIDTPSYDFEPVILERLPTLENGDATVRTVYAAEGDRVLDANGKVVELSPEMSVENAVGEEVIFDGAVISMTQVVVTFTLRADVTWSDGEPLNAEDSGFSYELAGQLDDAALQRRVERTASYEVADSQTIVWTGVPGYVDSYYLLNFFQPLPQHVLKGTSVEQLLGMDVAQRRPLGWGPFAVETWGEGDHITLVRNPHYFRASEGIPYLDRVTFRFVDGPQEAVEGLLAGDCDIVSEDLMTAGALSPLLEASETEEVRLVSAPSSEWEHLDFGIQPAGWSQRVSLLQDVATRQAIAHCVDRERIAGEAFPCGEPTAAYSYVAPRHPLYAGERLHRWAYDPITGRSMLEEVGWRDADGDGTLEAGDVSGVTRGTILSVTLLTTVGDPARQRTAEILQDNFEDCGVGLTIDYLDPDVFYADGPDGPVFGRQFDLALFSWLNGLGAPCELYLSMHVPREDNWWATSNNPGYVSDDYDAACQSALDALYGTADFTLFHHEAQRIFSHDLPVLPLYFVPRAIAVRSRVTGIALAPGEETPFWNIEFIDVER